MNVVKNTLVMGANVVVSAMDEFGICTRCEDTQFVDDLITLGDWLVCENCYEEL